MDRRRSMSKPRILISGSANMDLMARVQKAPDAGETLVGTRYEYLPGGKGANGAIAVARLGGESIFNARLGNDINGGRLKLYYEQCGIDTRFVSTSYDEHTGLAIVLVEEDSGENRIVVYPGANNELRPDEIDDALTSCPDALLMQLEIPAESVIAATHLANERKIPVVIDAGPADKDFPLEELGELEVFSPNESETIAYTGITPQGQGTCLKACMKLMSRVKARYIVLKLGARGAFIYDGTYCAFKPSHPVDAVDTTAAGDVFTAAMTYELCRSRDINRAVEFGNIAAGLSVTRAGASASIPTMDEVKEFAYEKEINFRF